MSGEAMARAMSLRRLSSLETRTPSPSSSTKRVTVGPTTGSSSRVGTSKRARVACSNWPRSATSALSMWREGVACSIFSGGRPHFDGSRLRLRAAAAAAPVAAAAGRADGFGSAWGAGAPMSGLAAGCWRGCRGRRRRRRVGRGVAAAGARGRFLDVAEQVDDRGFDDPAQRAQRCQHRAGGRPDRQLRHEDHADQRRRNPVAAPNPTARSRRAGTRPRPHRALRQRRRDRRGRRRGRGVPPPGATARWSTSAAGSRRAPSWSPSREPRPAQLAQRAGRLTWRRRGCRRLRRRCRPAGRVRGDGRPTAPRSPSRPVRRAAPSSPTPPRLPAPGRSGFPQARRLRTRRSPRRAGPPRSRPGTTGPCGGGAPPTRPRQLRGPCRRRACRGACCRGLWTRHLWRPRKVTLPVTFRALVYPRGAVARRIGRAEPGYASRTTVTMTGRRRVRSRVVRLVVRATSSFNAARSCSPASKAL